MGRNATPDQSCERSLFDSTLRILYGQLQESTCRKSVVSSQTSSMALVGECLCEFVTWLGHQRWSVYSHDCLRESGLLQMLCNTLQEAVQSFLLQQSLRV